MAIPTLARLRLPSFLLVATLFTAGASAADYFVYFGSHRSGPKIGFSLAHFDSETGHLTKPEFLLEAKEPAFFIIHPDGKHLYTCNSGTPGGATAYAIDPHSGHLTYINRVLSGGGDASYISLDHTHHYALVANYDGGNISAFALKPDGSLGDWTAFVQHKGTSADPVRQTHAYAHAILTDPTNRFVLVPDLGIDKLFIYRFDEKTGTLTANTPAFVTAPPGSGPRHVRFHPNGHWVYLVNEMGSTVIAFEWDSKEGKLTEFQTVSTLPTDFKDKNACAELEVHPDGQHLYVSNRGHNSIAVFSIDPTNGRLSSVEHRPSGGKTPRNFAFDPTGKWMICSNHDSNNAVVFRIDGATGKLTQVGEPVEVPAPFCERFLPVP